MQIDISRVGLYLSYIVLIGLITISAYTDFKARKIYNIVTVPCLCIGLLLGLVVDFPDAFLNRLLGFGLGFTLFFLMFAAGYMGGGDVKLVAAIGALMGYPYIIDAIFFGILCGGLYAVFLLLIKRMLWKNLKSVFRFIFSFIFPWRQTHSLKQESTIKIPYGFCISLGTLVAFIIHRTTSTKCFFLGF